MSSKKDKFRGLIGANTPPASTEAKEQIINHLTRVDIPHNTSEAVLHNPITSVDVSNDSNTSTRKDEYVNQFGSQETSVSNEEVTQHTDSRTSPDDESDKHHSITSSDDPFRHTVDLYVETVSRRKTQEETHTRTTFLIRNDLLERFNRVALRQKRGFKTFVINKLLEDFLNAVEDNKE
jgi:hypothetical protein